VASTIRRCWFFSSRGQVYRKRSGGCRWPAPNARRKALINILPLGRASASTTIMPLPEDESSWANLDVMFATTGGNSAATSCRFRRCPAFRHHRHEARSRRGDRRPCRSAPSTTTCWLTAAAASASASPQRRAGVFGPHLDGRARHRVAEGGQTDFVAVDPRHVEATSDERSAYLKMRRAVAGEPRRKGPEAESEETSGAIQPQFERYDPNVGAGAGGFDRLHQWLRQRTSSSNTGPAGRGR